MISFDEFLKQDEADKYNMLQECNAYIKSKDKEISSKPENDMSFKLNNIINELEKDVEKRLMSITDNMCDDALEEIKRTTKIAVYQVVLGKLQELKGVEKY